MGFIQATSGVARIWGHDCWHDGVRARADLGFLVPADALYPDMTGHALLDYMAALSGKPPGLRPLLLDALELGQDALNRRLHTYSKGMKQKLALTAAIQTNPRLLVLDEPTDGLDPLIQRSFEGVAARAARPGHNRLHVLARSGRSRADVPAGGDHQGRAHRRGRGYRRPETPSPARRRGDLRRRTAAGTRSPLRDRGVGA